MTDWGRTVPVVSDCRECDERAADPGMRHALASGGIERGMSTGEALRRYLEWFHSRGHRGAVEPAMRNGGGGDA